MCHSIRVICSVVAVALAATTVSALAQTAVTQKAFCVIVGMSPLEPIGDRAGHALQVSTYTCRTEGGPMDGGVMTGTTIYEWDAGKAVVLSGAGVGRKPGAMASFHVMEGTMALLMADGKVIGAAGAGKGVIKHASGSAAVLNGKTNSYTVRSTSPGQFLIETTYD